MKILVAIDSFKGSMSSVEAGNAAKKGIQKAIPNARVDVLPLADGGEGTAYALTTGLDGKWISINVTGPLGKRIDASYGIIEQEKMAIIEMASAAGITLVSNEERNPMNTTTYGVGEMIIDAINRGCRKFIIGIGGSATNDGGIGMLQALGFGVLDKNGKQVSFGAKGLLEIEKITDDNVSPLLKECTFDIACDVTNPLCGEQGCSIVFGPQKGADLAMIREMDDALFSFAQISKEKFPKADENMPGTGAAGGLGFAFLTFTNAKLRSGVDLVLDITNLKDYVKNSDIVVTGEGRLDAQTIMGKAPIGVARIAKDYSKPVIAFAGSVAKDATKCNNAGIDAFFPILRCVSTLSEAMNNEIASSNMEDTAEQVFRLIDILFN